jgi:arginase
MAAPDNRAGQVSLIGAPTDIGAGTRGASMGPEALRVAGLQAALEAHGLQVIDRGNLGRPANPWLPPVDGYRHLAEVVAWNQPCTTRCMPSCSRGRLPILLGGDHCLGIGSISAVARHCREAAASCACCGWTRMPTSTPACSRPAATCTACRWPACAATARRR